MEGSVGHDGAAGGVERGGFWVSTSDRAGLSFRRGTSSQSGVKHTLGFYQLACWPYRTPLMKTLGILTIGAVFALTLQTDAATIQFDLRGTAGFGLLPGNEPGSVTGGTGGEIGAGIFYDDATNLLTLNVGWGSSQGFTDLSSLSNNSHIHGPTAANNGSGFTQTAGVILNLTRSSNAVTGGTITTAPLTLTAPQATDLLNGKWYINLHTVNNGGGEMRGFLVQAVPEPSMALLGLVGGSMLLLRRRR